jgi:hypothetical protein
MKAAPARKSVHAGEIFLLSGRSEQFEKSAIRIFLSRIVLLAKPE